MNSQLIFQIIVNLFLSVICPIIFVLTLTYINRSSKRSLATRLGVNSQFYLGAIGIAIHEFSHALFALLFGHKIVSIKLLVFPWSKNKNDALGYVNHSWNKKSLYQNFGNLFIGIAPILGCSLALILLAYFLEPSLFRNWQQSVYFLVWQRELFQPQQLFYWIKLAYQENSLKFILYILLSLNITIGGFDLSNEDLANAKIPLAPSLAIFSVFIIICSLIWPAKAVESIIINVLLWLLLAFSISLLWSVISWILVKIISII